MIKGNILRKFAFALTLLVIGFLLVACNEDNTPAKITPTPGNSLPNVSKTAANNGDYTSYPSIYLDQITLNPLIESELVQQLRQGGSGDFTILTYASTSDWVTVRDIINTAFTVAGYTAISSHKASSANGANGDVGFYEKPNEPVVKFFAFNSTVLDRIVGQDTYQKLLAQLKTNKTIVLLTIDNQMRASSQPHSNVSTALLYGIYITPTPISTTAP